MKSSIFKKGTAILMSALTVLGMVAGGAMPVHAAAEVRTAITLTYPRSEDATYAERDKWGRQESHYMNGWQGDENDYFPLQTLDTTDGIICYCIEPGVSRPRGTEFEKFDENFWDNYPSDFNSTIQPDDIKVLLGRIMQYGYQGNLNTHWVSQNPEDADKISHAIATQMLVWETVIGERDANFGKVDAGDATTILSNLKKEHPLYDQIYGYYKSIEESVQKHTVIPSFTARSTGKAQTVELKWDGSKYTATLTDTNNILGKCTFTSDTSGVSFSVSGNKLTISSAKAPKGEVMISATKSNVRSGVITWSDGQTGYDGGYQDVVTYGATLTDPVKAFIKIKVDTGNLKLVKTSEDGKVSGISFNIKGNGIDQTVKTNEKGELSVNNLTPGTYTVTEQTISKYVPQKPQTVEIIGGKTATVTFANELKRGDLKVVKTSEDGLVANVKFHLYGTADCGLSVDEYAVTDEKGTAQFKDILIGSGYTLEEVETGIQYVVPEKQTAAVEWKKVTNKSVTNTLKKWNVTVTKVDAKTKKPQGDATLAGAVYGIYQGDTLIDTYVTDEKGQFTTKYYICGDNWSVKEIQPSEGYTLNDTAYPVGAASKNYTVELSTLEMEVNETVKRGRISIIKHSDSGETQIETPEEGATFEVYLKSAGSYSGAGEDVRDTLVCDEFGFAETKLLPYGIYTVHQTAGKEGAEMMKDFDVYVSEDGKTYRYLINNGEFFSYIKVIKVDAETGKTIPYAGAGFQIYRPDGSKVEMKFTYPEVTAIDTFYTNEEGMLITPEMLEYGKGYQLIEVQAPYGYVLSHEPVSFDVTQENAEEEASVTVVAVTMGNTAQKGIIRVEKTGEVFYTVSEGKGSYYPEFKVKGLAGAVYTITAAEDIVTPDGTIRYEKGTVVDEITTGEDGKAESIPLYLGKYDVQEKAAPYGMVLNEEIRTAELVYAGQEIEITEIAASFFNERQKISITLEKVMEKNESFGIGEGGEITAVGFGLYAAEEIKAEDGTSIPEGGLIEYISVKEDGTALCRTDLPFGKYYLQEIATDKHYRLTDAKYPVSFDYAGADIPVVEVKANEGKPISNEIKYGKVRGIKKSEDGEGLGGAAIGLFKAGEEKAIMQTTSGEDGIFAFDNIPYGDYEIREISAPEGFVLNETAFEVSVRDAGQVVELEIVNERIRGHVTLTKVDKDYPDHHLSGAVFEVYNESGELIGPMEELSDGVYRMEDLPYGKYSLKETKAPEGFYLDENIYSFEILKNDETVVVENEAGKGFINNVMRGSIRIEKTSQDGVLQGFTFKVEGADICGNPFSGEYVTDEKGMILIENLRVGEYVISEVAGAATEKYVLPADVTVTVLAGETAVAKIYNERKPEKPERPDVPKTGDTSDLMIWASLAALSAAGIGVLAVAGRRKKKKEEV